jgi:hypothetical protein
MARVSRRPPGLASAAKRPVAGVKAVERRACGGILTPGGSEGALLRTTSSASVPSTALDARSMLGCRGRSCCRFVDGRQHSRCSSLGTAKGLRPHYRSCRASGDASSRTPNPSCPNDVHARRASHCCVLPPCWGCLPLWESTIAMPAIAARSGSAGDEVTGQSPRSDALAAWP